MIAKDRMAINRPRKNFLDLGCRLCLPAVRRTPLVLRPNAGPWRLDAFRADLWSAIDVLHGRLMARWAAASAVTQDIVDEDVVPQTVGADLDFIDVKLAELVLHIL